MGQHKNPNRKPKSTRWILATKWFNENEKTNVVDEYWTPIGGSSKIPYSYATQQDAVEDLKEIAKLKDDLATLYVVALEVRYEPQKIKLLDKVWFKKHVKQEVMLKFVDKNKGKDIFYER